MIYASLFFDSLKGMLLIIPHRPYVFEVMKMFELYDKNFLIFIHLAASTLGIIINWAMGYVLRNLIAPMGYIENFKYYKYINKIMRSGMPAMLLVFSGIAGVVGVSLGLYRVALIRVLLVALMSFGVMYYA